MLLLSFYIFICCFFFAETSSTGRACLLLFSLLLSLYNTTKPTSASLALSSDTRPWLGESVHFWFWSFPGCRFLVLKLSNYSNQLHKLYLTSGCLFFKTLNSMEIRKQGEALCFVTLLCLWTCASGSLTAKGVNMEGNWSSSANSMCFWVIE